MNRKQCKELLPAIQHFAKGENLWAYDGKRWFKQTSIYLTHGYRTSNIIEDRHYEARKAYALGEEIEWRPTLTISDWKFIANPSWNQGLNYRPKPKEPVYEWQWLFKATDTRYAITESFYDDIPASHKWTKFEPSKRIRQ